MIDATQTTLYPGGILNTGFAVDWAKERIHDAKPAVAQRRASRGPYKRIQDGDTTCQDNQALHGEAVDLLAKIRDNDHYVPKVADPLVADHVRRQDQRAGLHGLPVDRRADRRPLPDARRAHDRHAAEVVHVHERHARRLARPGDLQPLVRLPQALRRPAGADRPLGGRSRPAAPAIYQAAMGISG